MSRQPHSQCLERRTLFRVSAGLLLLFPYMLMRYLPLLSVGIVRAEELTEDREITKEIWLNEFFQIKPPIGALHLFRFADEMYATTKPISWVPAKGEQQKTYEQVDVPIGFVTDFASVPRIFWQFLPRDGKYTYPAIVHDYLYWTQNRSREMADQILRIGMQEFGIDPIVVNAVYWSVRAAGDIAWKHNAKLKSQGERRILKRFPEDPLMKWQNWKEHNDVFA
ncbi:protein of unknown function [Nitrospira japonica]|uniref:DUF1353 domain-containing protein n=1 Tax=Nitrospira japonica TaxID=1325564 RepID=A0A1W1I389_9BACT|nr:DUF1353 domain-containing protein [Nitrospira japonica]SLM47435.1 protein of unknown function [Nitrospira japonica]